MTATPRPSADRHRQAAMQRTDYAEHLRQERDRFVAFSFTTGDILLELNADYTIHFADGALRGLLGYASDDLLGKEFLELIADEDYDMLHTALVGLERQYRLELTEVRLLSAYQDVMPFAVAGFRLSHTSPQIYLSLSLKRGDIPIEHLIKRDVETGLLNTCGFVESANDQIHQASQRGEALQLTLLDLPQLQNFVSELSSEQAATLLQEITCQLKQHSLEGDMAGMIDEEAFSVLHKQNHPAAQLIANLIALTRQYDPTQQGLEVRAQTIEAHAGELTSHDTANVLLYTLTQFAQSAGDNFTITSLAQSYDQLLEETVDKISHFKATVRTEEFNLAFQPIVDLKSGLIHHYEILVRMNNPEIFKNPFEFINFGEKVGVIADFDLVMTEKAFDVLEKTAKKGNKPVVAVNISGKSIGSVLFRDSLHRIIQEHPKVRKQVIFELTESAKIDNMQTANAFIQELRQGGNLCCLDDFGTGESSFDYLRNLQVDFIKIDGTYVRESLQNQRGRHMLKAMAGLCRDLNVTTIGEMVEDEDAASLLWESGIRFGQGYLFGKPVVDEETLINCKKPTPFYGGIMRARKMSG